MTKMEIAETPEAIVKVTLSGRLDSPGVDSIETQLTASLVPRAARAIVDLTHVEFLGSMAIRMFITLARTLDKRKGKLVLYGAQPLVRQVFDVVSLGEIVPIAADAAAATAAARG